jgi:AcrR family transcriptional regulator
MTAGTSTIRPLRADAQRNRALLVATARQAVAEQGGEVCLEEIARRAGVGIGTLYRHFPTRQALLEATFLDEANELRDEAERRCVEERPGAALIGWLQLHLEFGARGRSMGAAVMNAKHTDGSEIQLACADMREAGKVLLGRAQEAGEIRTGVDMSDMLRMMHAIVLVNEQAPEDPERVERMFELVIAGLRP